MPRGRAVGVGGMTDCQPRPHMAHENRPFLADNRGSKRFHEENGMLERLEPRLCKTPAIPKGRFDRTTDVDYDGPLFQSCSTLRAGTAKVVLPAQLQPLDAATKDM